MAFKDIPSFSERLQRQWQTGGLLSSLLLPLSWVAGLLVRLKSWLYRKGVKTQNRLPVPVIVVGNIYVGGTGKTPLVLALIAALRQRGYTPGVVSRGYGVDIGPEPRFGYGAQLSAADIGDEPAMLGREAPIAVHPNRSKAARTLLAQFPGINIIIADDGLQHLALARDIEIAVQDSRGIGNGRLLPAGPLREPASRLAQVDFIVINAPAAMRSPSSTDARHVYMQLYPTCITHLQSGRSLSLDSWICTHGSVKIAAIAGIGHPPRFFATLEQAGIRVSHRRGFADHHAYTPAELTALDADIILMTTKDAAKCREIPDERLWQVEVEPQFSDHDFFDRIARKLESLPVY